MRQTQATPDIAIIGGGVSGLTCAVMFAETGHRVTVFAEQVAQETTSGAAAAIWFPYDAEPADKVIPWAITTYQRLEMLATEPHTGVSMTELRCFAREGKISIPDWALALGACFLGRTDKSDVVTSRDPFPSIFRSGFAIRVPLTDTTRYLDYLLERFNSSGGSIKEGVHFQKIADVSRTFEIIVNCSGIGSRELAPDPEVEPHRGQIAIVPKFDLPCAIVSDDPPLMYVIPRRFDCVFGGTNSIDSNREPTNADTDAIVGECSRVLNITVPPVTATRVGLRPYRRSGVRLEVETTSDGRTVIHDYGHGGSGFTLSWGCAEDVLKLFNELRRGDLSSRKAD